MQFVGIVILDSSTGHLWPTKRVLQSEILIVDVLDREDYRSKEELLPGPEYEVHGY